MSKFLNGVMIGVGIGLLIAPMPGVEMRRRLGSRLQQMRGPDSENQQLNEYKQPMSSNETATGSAMKRTAESALNSDAPGSLSAQSKQPFSPAYPEYVNPELKPKELRPNT